VRQCVRLLLIVSACVAAVLVTSAEDAGEQPTVSPRHAGKAANPLDGATSIRGDISISLARRHYQFASTGRRQETHGRSVHSR
jgi:hypothetical protein